ncbi:MAG TPA: immunoglobulin-like domain-containing protein, partial [Xanthomarina sp.]|nr:immunoglobulin-like domain-containing protein [Xanthomarina sp.]
MKKKSTFYVLLITFLIISFNGLSKSIGISNYALDKNVYLSQNYNPLEDYVSLRPDYFKQEIAIATCNPITVYLDASGNITITPSDIDPSNVGPNFSLDISSFTCTDIGTPVTVTITDSSDSLTCTSIVTVQDTTAPVITLNGPATLTLEACSDTYTEQGANTTDNCTVGAVTIGGDTVDVNTPGTYTVTYNVTDANGVPAVEVTRTVTVQDTTAPVITLNGANPQTIEACDNYTELGATANDPCFGDISGSIVIDASAVNTAVVGTYTVTYNVDDADGNPAAQVTRTVNVVDTTAPTITLNGANPQTIEACGTYNELGATANDPCFGDITASIVIDASAVNTAVVGSYIVTYNVTDANGNPAAQLTRTVNVVDNTVPTITLVGANPQTIEACGTYNELGATANDTCFGDISGSIVIDASAVNTAVVGTYTVTYNVDDANGNAAVQITRTVNVVDTTIPTITLNGANPQVIEACDAYTELGATANDACFGDISGSIVIDASAVNTAVVGTYSVTYNVTDANGNPAAQVTLTVNVADTTIPTITLNGANPQTIEACDAYTELGATANDACFGD